MSYGFVSGGTAGDEVERDEEWKAAAKAIEDARRAKEDLAKQHDGKTLYEILQANKEKKQTEFEEKARFKLHNALDDDEADYLDAVLENKRKEEANIRKETLEQLDLFRQQQKEAERVVLERESSNGSKEHGGEWAAIGRKRKKVSEAGLLRGVKLRKSSSTSHGKKLVNEAKQEKESTQGAAVKTLTSTINENKSYSLATPLIASTKPSSILYTAKPLNALSLGLGYASSDDET